MKNPAGASALEKKSRPQRAAFPLRVAAVDLGSNAIRFVAAEFLNAKRYVVLESERAPVRLGSDAFPKGRLSPAGMRAAQAALARFSARLKILRIEHCRLVATSAVRESANGEAFARRIQEQLGLPLEIISGPEETQLVYRAVKSLLPKGKRPWLLANLGGGSLEVALVNAQGVLCSETHTLGAVRLWEEFKSAAGRPGLFVHLLEEYVSTLRLSLGGITGPWAGFIATGGNIEALAKMASAPQRSGGFRDLTAADLAKVLSRLPAMSLKARMARFGIGPDRADVVVPAAVVYAHLAFLSGQTRLRVPELGTKEGILFDLVDRLTLNSDYIFRLEKQLMQLAVSLGRRYQFDEAHGRQVCRLALQLFEELAPLHGLDPGDHRILLVASLLHDIGTYISFKKHHKHSQYLIAQSELPGMSAGDMNLAAHVARYHRKNTPQLEHESFARLEKSERRRVTRLAALLRIADALDRDHAQTVRRLKARIRRPYLELNLEGLRSGRLEPWALRRKAKLFTEMFGLRVRLMG